MRRVLVLVLVIVLLLVGCAIKQPPGNRSDYLYVTVRAIGGDRVGYMLKSDVEAWKEDTLNGRIKIYGVETYIMFSSSIVEIRVSRSEE